MAVFVQWNLQQAPREGLRGLAEIALRFLRSLRVSTRLSLSSKVRISLATNIRRAEDNISAGGSTRLRDSEYI
jgi:hypothetical protein